MTSITQVPQIDMPNEFPTAKDIIGDQRAAASFFGRMELNMIQLENMVNHYQAMSIELFNCLEEIINTVQKYYPDLLLSISFNFEGLKEKYKEIEK